MPNSPPLSRLDLNLLIALDALLAERSVTRAAERLHLSQPALSASLSRLRTHFNDQLLARRGNSYELTPLAVRLVEHTSTALEAARRVFDSQSEWSPETSHREFLVFGSDYSLSTIGQMASRLAATSAPQVKFRFELHTPAVVDDAANRLRSADGMLVPHGHLTGLNHTDHWTDRWVVLADRDHPGLGEHLTTEDLSANPWVFTYQSRSAFTPAGQQSPSAFTSVGQQLQSLGLDLRVEVVVQSFLALPFFLRGTRRLGIVQGALASELSALPSIRMLELPFEAVPVANALWWHPAHSHDSEHAWMRSLFQRAGELIAAQQS